MYDREVLVVDGVRTAIGKYDGALKGVRPDDLSAIVIRDVLERTGIDPAAVDDVFWGAANQAGEDNRNVARMALLLAGLPETVPGVTLNRLCASGLQAVISGAREIQVGAAEIIIAGGAESMTRAPYVLPKPSTEYARGNQTMFDSTLGWRMVNQRLAESYPPITLGETAENVADRYDVTRLAQDEWALRSHQRAVLAQDSGRFAIEIVPVATPTAKGAELVFDTDEGPRRDTNAEKLSRLRPAFREHGTVTAGNSSQLNDGAAAVLLASRETADRFGLKPLARFVDAAAAGVDPAYMGIGPVPATRKLLKRAGVAVAAIGTVEMNEAFAAQVLACVRELGLAEDRVNPNGGAIALGHPLGASGARLVATLAHEIARRGHHYGLATMCVGVGQGVSALLGGVA